jgi:hypothetical protein
LGSNLVVGVDKLVDLHECSIGKLSPSLCPSMIPNIGNKMIYFLDA